MTLTEGRLGFVLQKVPAFAANGSNRYRIERGTFSAVSALQSCGRVVRQRAIPVNSLSFPIGWGIDLNYADAIEGVLPLHYGKGLHFFVHVKVLSTQPPPRRLRLSAHA